MLCQFANLDVLRTYFVRARIARVILCTDFIFIYCCSPSHFITLTQLGPNLSSMRSHLVALDKERSSQPSERFDQTAGSLLTVAPSSTPINSLRSPIYPNFQAPHRVESVDGRMSSNTGASFCVESSRHATYQRCNFHSFTLRHFSLNGVLSSDRPSYSSLIYPASISYYSQTRSGRNDAFHSRRHIPQRNVPPKLI